MTVFTPEIRLLKALARLNQSAQLYPNGSDILDRDADSFLSFMKDFGRKFKLTLVGKELCIDQSNFENPGQVETVLVRTLRAADWEGVSISPRIDRQGLIAMARALNAAQKPPIEGDGWHAEYVSYEAATDTTLPPSSPSAVYLRLLGQAREAVYSVAAGEAVGVKIARSVAVDVREQFGKGEDLLGPIRTFRRFDEFTYTHGFNVALLVHGAGRALGIGEKLLEEITMGALCHDVGKERIPKEVLHKASAYTDEERTLVRRHPLEGAKIIAGIKGGAPPLMAVIAYEHHMRAVEGGYPERIGSHAPHPAALLVAVADAYDALRTNRPYKKASDQSAAFTEILADSRVGRLDKRVLPAFAAALGLSRPGTHVRLTDGRAAFIIEECPRSPLKPVVAVGKDRVDLLLNPGLGIASFESVGDG